MPNWKELLNSQKILLIENIKWRSIFVCLRGRSQMEHFSKTLYEMQTKNISIIIGIMEITSFYWLQQQQACRRGLGGYPMTTMVRILGGFNSIIHSPMIIFHFDNGSHPIRGVSKSVSRVHYWSFPKEIDGRYSVKGIALRATSYKNFVKSIELCLLTAACLTAKS